MIKCKEDLINTYIENDYGELRDLYLAKCEAVCLKINPACLATKSDFIFVKDVACPCGSVDHSTSLCYLNGKYGRMKRLTLSDFKPTRTEYEKVPESIFDLRDEFERGELYF